MTIIFTVLLVVSYGAYRISSEIVYIRPKKYRVERWMK
jgi:hypothetical protein